MDTESEANNMTDLNQTDLFSEGNYQSSFSRCVQEHKNVELSDLGHYVQDELVVDEDGFIHAAIQLPKTGVPVRTRYVTGVMEVAYWSECGEWVRFAGTRRRVLNNITGWRELTYEEAKRLTTQLPVNHK